MHARELDRFVGLPYDAHAFDCADLVALVQRELFARDIALPGRHARMRAPAATVARAMQGDSGLSGELAYRISESDLQDGDLVLMTGDTLHLGTVFVVAGGVWVLHAFANVGYSALQRLADLRQIGLKIEGYYRCR
jgi:hypothetical protein